MLASGLAANPIPKPKPYPSPNPNPNLNPNPNPNPNLNPYPNPDATKAARRAVPLYRELQLFTLDATSRCFLVRGRARV